MAAQMSKLLVKSKVKALVFICKKFYTNWISFHIIGHISSGM